MKLELIIVQSFGKHGLVLHTQQTRGIEAQEFYR